jgi:hypothetical protein
LESFTLRDRYFITIYLFIFWVFFHLFAAPTHSHYNGEFCVFGGTCLPYLGLSTLVVRVDSLIICAVFVLFTSTLYIYITCGTRLYGLHGSITMDGGISHGIYTHMPPTHTHTHTHQLSPISTISHPKLPCWSY